MKDDPSRPLCIAIAGPNGSGKTTLTRGLLPVLETRISDLLAINPDDIALGEFGDRPYESVILEAAQKAQDLREAAVLDGRSFLFETVFSGLDKLAFLRRAKDAGYVVQFVFIATDDAAVNCARVALRAATGGHDVPRDRILARYSKSIANAVQALTFADRGYVFDNTPWWETPSLVFSTVGGLVSELGFSTMNGADCPWGWTSCLLDRVAAHAYRESPKTAPSGEVDAARREAAKASLRASQDIAEAAGLDQMSDAEIQDLAMDAKEARKRRKPSR